MGRKARVREVKAALTTLGVLDYSQPAHNSTAIGASVCFRQPGGGRPNLPSCTRTGCIILLGTLLPAGTTP